MKVYIVWHLEPGYEIDVVAVYDSEDKAKAYIAEYEKDNAGKPDWQWKLADYQEFGVL